MTHPEPLPANVPPARVTQVTGGGWSRLLPLAALVLAALLLREAWKDRGPRIAIQVADGHGLRAGDALRYRGIDVGEVESLELADDARGVVLRVRLQRSARSLARAGTRFWIARPVLGVEGVQGLETALGARYVAALPGPEGGEPRADFVALEEPPLFEADDPEALEVVLQADDRAGLARGAPVLFRGIAIGSLVSVGLASDASAIEARARILAPYAELVRADSRFYRDRGARLSLGLAGLELSIDSLQSLWLGGVGLATPTHPGPRAESGQRFPLAPELDEDWLGWRPALALGNALLPPGATVPERVWAVRREPRGWLRRERRLGGWVLATGGTLLGPEDLLGGPGEHGKVTLEVLGETRPLSEAPTSSGAGLARRPWPDAGAPSWSGLRRELAEPEDLLLFGDPARAPTAVAGAHLERGEDGWHVAPHLVFDERWHGAVALARADGAWVGVLLVADQKGRLAPVPGD